MRIYKVCIRPANPLDAAPKSDYDEGRAWAEESLPDGFESEQEEDYNELFGCFKQCAAVHRSVLQGLPGVQRRGLQKPDPRPRCQGRGRYGHPQL